MNRNIDFSKMSNAEINLKKMGYNDQYELKKSQIIDLIHDLQDLDYLYNKAKDELNKRGVLNDG
jgi:hypothetical protein